MGKRRQVSVKSIDDTQAIAFSNVTVRRAADALAQMYYAAVGMLDSWFASNDKDIWIEQNSSWIRRTADQLYDSTITSTGLVTSVSATENVWFNVGDPVPLNQAIPNDPNEYVDDGSPEDGRPPITGADVHNLVQRCRDIGWWWEDGEFGSGGGGGQQEALTNVTVVVGGQGNIPLQRPQVENFLTRLGQLRENYEANSNAHLNQILAVAVNPRG